MNSWMRLGVLAAVVGALHAAPAAAQTKPAAAPQAKPAAAQAKPAAPAAVTPAAIAAGDSIFHKSGNCYACHSATAEGTPGLGPNLTDAEWIHGDGSFDMIVATVTTGIAKEVSKSGVVMPAKGGSTITDDQVKQVAAYIYSLSHK